MAKAKIIIDFKARISKLRYKADDSDFKIYVAKVDKSKYKDVKANKKGEHIISGELHELVSGVEYNIRAEESVSNYGFQYKVINIKRDKPITLESSKKFLNEILNENQTEVLLNLYPNIIDKVIKNDLSDIDLNKTKGIKEKTFDKIKTKIVENFALIDILDKFDDALTFNNIRKLYDRYHSVEEIEKELKKDPYKCLCNLSRIGFKTADKILLNIEKLSKTKNNLIKFDFQLINSKQRMLSSIMYVLESNESNGNTVMKIKTLTKECNDLTPECMTHFLALLKENDDMFCIDDKRKLIAFKETYQTEEYICNKLNLMLENPIKWAVNSEAYRLSNGIELTKEQTNTIELLANQNVVILTAPAGAGKTESVKSVLNMLDERKLTYRLMTPTGKSSEVLSQYTKLDAGTIHRKLGYKVGEDGRAVWSFNEKFNLPEDVIVVDEFSMVDISLFKHLLEAINHKRTKLILVFDAYQLASVGAGNLAHDLLQSKKIPTNLLTKIFRYGEGGLMNVATKIRSGEEFIEKLFKGVKVFGKNKDFIFAQRSDVNIVSEIVKLYQGLLAKDYLIEDIMVLSAQNKGSYGVGAINKAIQDIIQIDKEKPHLKRGDVEFYEGDKVIQTINNYQAEDVNGNETPVYNGNTGIVKVVEEEIMIIDFKGKLIEYSKSDLKNIELGYSFTIHRSQGDSAKQVIVACPNAHMFNMNSNLLYVGCTRAKERCYFIGNPLTVCRAIKKKENFKRETMIKYLL